jgi:hypothetical protein
MDGERFVFIDETAATTAMTRLSGWGPRGERLVDAVPAGHWKTTTVVAGLRASGIIAPFVLTQLEHRVLKKCSAPNTCVDARGL